MDLSIIKNKYNHVKNYLKESIFSKNKSILCISDFSKKSTIKKILTFTSVNLFVLLPYILWVSSSNRISISIPLLITSFTSVLLLSNTLFFTTTKIISSLLHTFRPKVSVTDSLLKKSTDNLEIKAQYFEKGFMGRIKEFFIATGSVATSFIPFIVLTNIILLSYFIQHSHLLSMDKSFFTNPINYLRIDGVILIFLTTLTTGSIYSFRALSFFKKVLLKALKAKKDTEENKNDPSLNNNSPSQKIFPVEEFIPSLSQEFKKSHDINIYNEIKTHQDTKN